MYWKTERDYEINKANREGPSQEHLNKLKLIDEAAKAAHERAHPPRGFKAMLRVDAEERSSKSFFSLFKNKLASAGINCLHVTNDWTDPNTKSGITNTVTDILHEATKYYTYLFRERKSTHNERLLQFIKDKPFTKKAKNHMDRAISTQETQKAIDALANGKSPGPDGIPAEFYKTFNELIHKEFTNMLNAMHE